MFASFEGGNHLIYQVNELAAMDAETLLLDCQSDAGLIVRPKPGRALPTFETGHAALAETHAHVR